MKRIEDIAGVFGLEGLKAEDFVPPPFYLNVAIHLDHECTTYCRYWGNRDGVPRDYRPEFHGLTRDRSKVTCLRCLSWMDFYGS